MPDPINIHDAKSQLSRLVLRAEAGDETVIARAGRPVAKLVPLTAAARPRRLGLLKGKVKVPADFDAPLPDAIASLFEGR